MCNSRFFVVTGVHYTVEAKLFIEIPTEAVQKDTPFKTRRSEIWRCFVKSSERSENSCVAVKSITFNRNPSEDEVEVAKKIILHQASIWIELYHDNILRLEGVISDGGFGLLPALVSPWMENGSLDNYLNVRQPDLDKKLFVLREIAVGLQYLHSKDIYSDLTPADILIDGDGKPYLRGFSVWMVIAGSEATTFQSECRDRYRWMAPEKFSIQDEEGGEQLTKTAEIYSYGCIMIMLFSGHRPYHSKQDSNDIILAKLDEKQPFEQFGGLDDDPELKELAQQCLLRSSERPPLSRITDLLTHRINVSNAIKLSLLELPVKQIPKAALSTYNSDDWGGTSGTMKCNWLHESSTTVVAVMTLDVDDSSGIDRICGGIRREIYVRERLKHDTILDLYGITTGFGILPSFVYPWMEHGSLHDYLKREFSRLSPRQKFDILYRVADGIKYLHKNNIVHGSLTGDSVLLDDAGRVRIADFSRSVILDDAGDWKSSEQLPGAARYVPPESVVRDEQIGPPQPTKTQDVYSYGCITILVLSGKVPYWWISEESDVLSAKVQGVEPFLPSVEIDEAHLDLVRCCLSTSIESRPSIGEALYSILVQHFGAADLTKSVTRLNSDRLARGSFAGVYMCTFRPSMSATVKVAVKEIMLRNESDTLGIINRLFREIKIWIRLEHENIVPFWGVTDGFGSLPALVSPWLENGTLKEYLEREHRTLSYSQKFALLRDVARGLQYLHSQSTIHGDLHSGNILIDNSGKASLADFGLSSFLPGTTSDLLPLYPTNPMCAMAFAPPEYLMFGDDDSPSLVHSIASDVYSFGGIMLMVLEGKTPYHYIANDMRIMLQKIEGITPNRPSESVISNTEWDFIQRCWLLDMDGRPLDSEILTFVEGRAGTQS